MKPPGSRGQLQPGSGSAGLGVLCGGRGAGEVLAGSTGLGSSFPSLCLITWLLFLPAGILNPRVVLRPSCLYMFS